MPEGEEKSKKLDIHLKKIMKENFPNLVKDIDMQVQEAQRVQNRMDAKSLTLRHIIIKLPKVKNKERLLKAAREKQLVIYRMSSHKTVSWFLKGNIAGQKVLERNIQSHENWGPSDKIALPSKATII